MYKDKDYQKKYRESHKDKMKATGRAWYLNNLELSKERQRVRTANRTPIEKIAEKNYQNKWRAENYAYKQEYNKEYRMKFPMDKIYYRNYKNTRYKTDLNFRLRENLGSRLRIAIHNNQKVGSAVKD